MGLFGEKQSFVNSLAGKPDIRGNPITVTKAGSLWGELNQTEKDLNKSGVWTKDLKRLKSGKLEIWKRKEGE